MDQIERIAELSLKYLQGSLTRDEELELEVWNNESPLNRERFEQRIRDADILTRLALYQEAESDKQEVKARMNFTPIGYKQKVVKISHKWWRVTAAAVFVVVISAVCFLLLGNQKGSLNGATSATGSGKPAQGNDLLPGSDRATLTLASGRVIVLDSTANDQLAMQGAVRVTKHAGGLLAYTVTGAGLGAVTNTGAGGAKNAGGASAHVVPTQVSYNVLTTPKAGQFQVDLPDGTHVWLNNASSLRYPTVFVGASREVELQGEAFFQVVHDARKPFRVRVGELQVQDIGTSFNIMAYADEPSIQTTLVEGSAKVISKESALTLSPGQQAQADANAITLHKHANIEQAIAWKNGNFQFENADIRTVLRQLSRWYDVDKVVYEGKQTEHSFSGTIPRDYNASDVLKILELSDVHFKIQGKMIVVSE